MRWTPCPRHVAPAVSLIVLVLCSSGCQSVRNVVDPLNLSGLGRGPVRIGVTRIELSPPPLLLPKTALLQDDLFYRLGEPISLDVMTPRQIRVHLGTGRLKFAMLSASDYAEVAPAGTCRILSVPLNEHGQTSRKGLIITSPRSRLSQLSDIRNRPFHFMPRGHALNAAARAALLDAGMTAEEIDEGLVLGLGRHHISSLEVAKSVVLEKDVAGVIDEADYLKWKKTGGSLVLLSPSQDEVRVIGETVTVPEGPVVVSLHTDPEMVAKVKDYFLNVAPRHKFVLASLGCTGFTAEYDPKVYDTYMAVYRRLNPEPPTIEGGEWEPSEVQGVTSQAAP